MPSWLDQNKTEFLECLSQSHDYHALYLEGVQGVFYKQMLPIGNINVSQILFGKRLGQTFSEMYYKNYYFKANAIKNGRHFVLINFND